MDLQAALARIEELEEQLELQRMLADNAFETIGVFNEDMKCVAANKETQEVLGYTPEEALGKHILEFLGEDSREMAISNMRTIFNEPYYLTGLRKDGTEFPAEARGKEAIIKGKPYRSAALRDISFRNATLNDLQASLHEMELIFANTKVGLMFLQGGRTVKRVNRAMAEMLGYDAPEDMSGLDVRHLHLSRESHDTFGKDYYNSLADGAQLRIEYRLKRKDGSPIWCSLSGQAIDTERPVDLTKGVLWVIDDITEQKAREKRLVRMATTDDLTGALTRKEFFRLSKEAIEQEKRRQAGPSMLMVDLDYFKQINDVSGHEAGDEVLRQFANKCRDVLRSEDLLARIGGEEFAIFLPDTDLGGAMAVAERLRSRVKASRVVHSHGSLAYTISIGVATAGSNTPRIGELLRRADHALYKAKHEGRDQVNFYD